MTQDYLAPLISPKHHFEMVLWGGVHQELSAGYVQHIFGTNSNHPDERICRFGEEAVELLQAAGRDEEWVVALVRKVYARAADPIPMEIGGALNTLLAYAESQQINAAEVAIDLWRKVAEQRDHFAAKSDLKHR